MEEKRIKEILERLERAERALEVAEVKGCTFNEECNCAKCKYFKEYPFSVKNLD